MNLPKVMATLRHWLLRNRVDLGTDSRPLKVTIEAPTVEAASALLFALKRDFEPTIFLGPFDIDLDKPFRLMGIEVMFKMPEGYRRSEYVFRENLFRWSS